MSVASLIEQANARNKQLTPITVRVSDAISAFVETITESTGISKQDLLLELLSSGMEQALRDLERKPDPAPNAKFHILNTNKAHTDEDQAMMLHEGIAAAFYDPWKLNINRIKKDDWIFLYENRRGIIAYGQGSGDVLKRDHQGNKDECHYQILKGFTTLATPLSAAKIKEVLDRNQVFARTMTGLPDGQKILAIVKALK
jgi:hypothetical protein